MEKIAREVCEVEFKRFADAMDLDLDQDAMTPDDRAQFLQRYRVIMRAMERGKLVVDDDGQMVFTPSEGEPLTFYEMRGRDTANAIDGGKESEVLKREYRYLGTMTRTSSQRFHDMLRRDLKVCQAVAAVFTDG